MHDGYDPDEAPLPDAGIFGLPHAPDDAKLVLIPVPWDVTTSYRPGAARGPEAIRRASHQLDLYDLELGEPWRQGICMLDVPADLLEANDAARKQAEPVIACGGRVKGQPDLEAGLRQVNDACARMNEWVEARTDEWIGKGKVVGVVGGDHSAPLGAIRRIAREHRDVGILHVDAHADLREAYEGFTWSHASIMHNVLEAVPEVKRIVQVGVRDLARREFNRIQHTDRLATFFGYQLREWKHRGDRWEKVASDIVDALPSKVYVSFDVDGLDPSLCPNTGTPVPGGLTFDEVCTLLRVLGNSERTIVGFDLCEVAPGADDEWDANVGARILYKLCGWTLETR